MVVKKSQKAQTFSADELKGFYATCCLSAEFEEKPEQFTAWVLIKVRFLPSSIFGAGKACCCRAGSRAAEEGEQSRHHILPRIMAICFLAVVWIPTGLMAELTGPEGGYSKGRVARWHMFARREAIFRRARHCRRARAIRARVWLVRMSIWTTRVHCAYFGEW